MESDMHYIDFTTIVNHAWAAYDSSRPIKSISDISARVSTNHVYKIIFPEGDFVIAKLSYFGKYDHFIEDHSIINVLANNLNTPFNHFLARSLIKGNQLFVHRYKDSLIDAWVVFYNPVTIDQKLPARLNHTQIERLGEEFAAFHKACSRVSNTLPPSSKTLKSDLYHLLDILSTDFGQFEHRLYASVIQEQCERFFTNSDLLRIDKLQKLPVFVDWNIGNFSVTNQTSLFSRWDYDWFRMASRILDFYFLSRIVSDAGDRTVFSYNISTLMEDRFMLFLKAYHRVYPLTETEIRFIPEVYRFFILNYVIKDGRYFFHEIYATKLQKEAYSTYLPSIEKEFNADKLLRALAL
ncbi:MAG: hypothetical protein LW711_04515 [Saprospiraceae bacterium]|jgi:hypothetical protein|nr:hypothetical protein [Saprospiraceae bacterium]